MNEQKVDRKTIVLFLCIAGFIGGLLISNITASKLYFVSIFGQDFTIPVGTSLFALTFICTDVISEVWGKHYSSLLVLAGFLARIGALIFLYFAVNIEGAGAPVWDSQEAYGNILSGSSRIILAGILTYPVSQLTDIYLFHYLKKRQQGKNLLWLRNTTSTFFSQLVDSAVFVFIAFGGLLETPVLINIIIGQVLVKWIIAMIDTPIVYMVRNVALDRKLFDFSG